MKNIKFIMMIALVLFFTSCKDDSNPVIYDDVNLISNPSFEENGNPTLRGWEVSGSINFYEDTPAGGGKYSVGINTVWGIPEYISVTVPVSEGKRIFTFTCWSKAERLPSEISMHLIRDTIITNSFVTVSDSNWKSYTIVDTISVVRGDSLRIYLKGGSSQLLSSKTFYDNCILAQRNSR